MKLLSAKSLTIPEIKVVRLARFCDHRGYFMETFRKSDFVKDLPFMKNYEFYQANESCSKTGTVRGLHFQWNPHMGKLVRTLYGRMVDMILDIRKNSPTFGKAIAYDMPADNSKDYMEWIWIPPGFAHGNYFTENSAIEYFCTAEWNPKCEAGISPLSKDIDWSLCDKTLSDEFKNICAGNLLMTDKDKNGFTLSGWLNDEKSNNFIYKGE